MEIEHEFNNYKERIYCNISVCLTADNRPIANPNHQLVYDLCSEMNPCDSSRPLRTSTEILDKFTEIKTEYTRAYGKYKKSGYQEDDDDPVRTFKNFVGTESKLVYCFALWRNIQVFSLGRILDDNGRSDTAVGEDPAEPLTPHQRRTIKKKSSPSRIH